MNKKQFKTDLLDLRSLMDHLNNMTEMGFDIEGRLMKPLFATIEFIVRLLESVYEDNSDKWIEYFVFECDFGRSPHEIEDEDGKKYLIDSEDSFIEFFEDCVL